MRVSLALATAQRKLLDTATHSSRRMPESKTASTIMQEEISCNYPLQLLLALLEASSLPLRFLCGGFFVGGGGGGVR